MPCPLGLTLGWCTGAGRVLLRPNRVLRLFISVWPPSIKVWLLFIEIWLLLCRIWPPLIKMWLLFIEVWLLFSRVWLLPNRVQLPLSRVMLNSEGWGGGCPPCTPLRLMPGYPW